MAAAEAAGIAEVEEVKRQAAAEILAEQEEAKVSFFLFLEIESHWCASFDFFFLLLLLLGLAQVTCIKFFIIRGRFGSSCFSFASRSQHLFEADMVVDHGTLGASSSFLIGKVFSRLWR